jgi:para-aminobenzoate synthetase/4-amino-4-deoxychorismate lyase
VLLDRHLRRIEASARHFRYSFSIPRVRDALAVAVAEADRPQRVRLLVDARGVPRVETFPLEPSASPSRVALAEHPIDPSDVFVYHKTTNRAYLERERVVGVDDTVMWNPRGEVTEAITANIVVDLEGQKVTPPMACGLLPGVMRAELLERGALVEACVSIEQLRGASRVWLINSVRGWREAVLTADARSGA